MSNNVNIDIIINYINFKWDSWESRAPMYFLCKEALVSCLVNDLKLLDHLGYIKLPTVERIYLLFLRLKGLVLLEQMKK